MLTLQALFFATLFVIARCDLELKLIHVLFRHGEKVPHRKYQNYPTDPHGNHSYYPVEDGGLTDQGMRREYKIGTILRERYNQFFGPIYQPSTVYAQSTQVARTQMSLQLVLAGLFPPSEAQTWNPHLLWLPKPTFSVPPDQDQLLFPDYCPRYQRELEKLLKKSDIQEIVSKYNNTMEYLTMHSGKPVKTTSAVLHLYNLLKEQSAQNLTLPEWTQRVFPNPMKEITALEFHLQSYTKNLKRLNGGILLRKMVKDILDLRDETLKPMRKAFFFGAHEMNIAALAYTLGTDDPVIPAYGSTIILETLRDKKNQYFIKVILWTGVTERLVTQKIPGCTEVCPLDEFLEIIDEVIPSDAEFSCTKRDNDEDKEVDQRRKPIYQKRQSSSGYSSSSSGAQSLTNIPGLWQLAFTITLVNFITLIVSI